MAGTLLQLFPAGQRALWSKVAEKEDMLEEIRLRAERPVCILTAEGEKYLDAGGNYTQRSEECYCIPRGVLWQLLQHICQDSLYAYEEELRQGYITVAGGHRIGLCGQVVWQEGRVKTLKNISAMNIRITHEKKGVADAVLPGLYEKGALLSTLIISPPGCGKTTLLRDLVRQVSNGNTYGTALNVGVVDERSELAGCFQGIPQNDMGMRTDVLDGCPKAWGMMMLLRSMSPRVIAVDEIGGSADVEALLQVAHSGCRLLATIHGENVERIRQKENLRELFREGIFERFVVLEKREGVFVARVET